MKTYLLDTHYLLWTIADTKKIPKKIKEIIIDPGNRITVSTISFWEVSLKTSLGKLSVSGFSPADLPEACTSIGIDILPLTEEDCSSYHELKALHHRDPFDRMLIWQAIRNHFTLISMDSDIRKYVSEGLKVL